MTEGIQPGDKHSQEGPAPGEEYSIRAEKEVIMGKSHRDNHKARLKRGMPAFKKKFKRRHPVRVACNICGTVTRRSKLAGGICPLCNERFLGIDKW